jgi:hypothetical protein
VHTTCRRNGFGPGRDLICCVRGSSLPIPAGSWPQSVCGTKVIRTTVLLCFPLSPFLYNISHPTDQSNMLSGSFFFSCLCIITLILICCHSSIRSSPSWILPPKFNVKCLTTHNPLPRYPIARFTPSPSHQLFLFSHFPASLFFSHPFLPPRIDIKETTQ